MHRSWLSLLAAGTLASGAWAQAQAQAQAPVYRAVPPKYAGTYKMATGEFVPASRVRNAAGTVVIFNNTTPTDYYSVPGYNQEWIDEGILNDRNNCDTEQLACFEVIYCSTDPAASGTIIYTFYDETIECTGPTGGVPGQPNCAYALSGLPMGTPTGGIQCWIVTVDLNGVECPDNTGASFRSTGAHAANPLFGWGILPQLNNTGPWLRKGGKGTVNDFVWYDRNAGTNVGCFWFGGVPFAGFSMKIWGYNRNSVHYVDNDTNTANARWGTKALDTKNLVNGTDVVAGSLAYWTVTNPTAGRVYALVYEIGGPTVSNFAGQGGATGTALVSLWTAAAQNFPMPGGSLSLTVPSSVPPAAHVQAFELQGGSALANVTGCSNGIRHCLAGGGNSETPWTIADNGAVAVGPYSSDRDIKIQNDGIDRVRISIPGEPDRFVMPDSSTGFTLSAREVAVIQDDKPNNGNGASGTQTSSFDRGSWCVGDAKPTTIPAGPFSEDQELVLCNDGPDKIKVSILPSGNGPDRIVLSGSSTAFTLKKGTKAEITELQPTNGRSSYGTWKLFPIGGSLSGAWRVNDLNPSTTIGGFKHGRRVKIINNGDDPVDVTAAGIGTRTVLKNSSTSFDIGADVPITIRDTNVTNGVEAKGTYEIQ